MEDVQPLEPALDFGLGEAAELSGLVSLKIFRATEKQLASLKCVLERNPGTYEVFIQIMPEETHQPFWVPYRVDPSDETLELIKGSVGRCETNVIHPKQIGIASSEEA